MKDDQTDTNNEPERYSVGGGSYNTKKWLSFGIFLFHLRCTRVKERILDAICASWLRRDSPPTTGCVGDGGGGLTRAELAAAPCVLIGTQKGSLEVPDS